MESAERKPRVAHPIKRVICALLACGGVLALVSRCDQALVAEAFPNVGDFFSIVAGAFATYIFGLYAYRGHG
jgi:hypothetical protein